MLRPDTERVAPQRSYLGAGKLAELVRELAELRPDTVIFDDELTPGQLRNLEKACLLPLLLLYTESRMALVDTHTLGVAAIGALPCCRPGRARY